MVVGPIYGGSLETARSTARAMRGLGTDARLLDFSAFSGGWDALSRFQVPASARTALQARYAEVLGEAVLHEVAAWRPDLVLALAQAPIGVGVLDQLRGAGIRTAFWFVENFRVLPYWARVAPAYDVFFAIQQDPFLGQLRAAGARKAVYLPTACDRHRHVPVALTEAERTTLGADVSFAGAPYLNRRRLLLALTDYSPRLWGEGWDKTELAHYAADGGRRFSLPEMVRVFSATRVNLNIHSAAHVDTLDPDPDYVNPRTFELAACGAFQLVDEREPLRDLFAEDEVVSFRSLVELRDQVGYYLAHDDERAAMAARARTRALAEHTFEHRAATILRETLEPSLLEAARLGPARESLDEAIRRAEQAPAMSDSEAVLRALKQLEVHK
jgi:spore maturation protein CgeB